MRQDLSPAWGAVVTKAMAKDPAGRFASANDFAMATQMALLGVRPAGSIGPDEQT